VFQVKVDDEVDLRSGLLQDTYACDMLTETPSATSSGPPKVVQLWTGIDELFAQN